MARKEIHKTKWKYEHKRAKNVTSDPKAYHKYRRSMTS